MKPNGLAAFIEDLALHLVVGCVVAFLVFAIMRSVHPVGAIEHELAAGVVRAASGRDPG